ncbi:alcohol oxidase, partial [Pholiota conissans]
MKPFHYSLAASLLFHPCFAATLSEPSQLTTLTYDYIIVGAGNAGLVIANRLTENPGTTVLVLEAGVSDQNVVPAMAPFLGPTVTPNTPYDWNYTVVPQAGMDNRTFPYPRGRLLGGSSSANYLLHQYGPNDDWNRMGAVTGDPGWAWDNMSKYLQRHERFVQPSDGHNTTDQFIPSLHSFTGEVPVSLPVFNQSIDARVIATTQQLAEFPYNEDMSGISGTSVGVGWVQSSMSQGLRSSSSTTYLADANGRPNLTVLINALVVKLVQTPSLSGTKAFRAVEFTDARSQTGSTFHTVQANKEVILSAGSIGSVQILQLSGIGAPEDLTPLNITVLVDSPQLGKNMNDHTLLPNIYSAQGNDSFDHLLMDSAATQAALTEWAVNKTGFISNNVANNFGFSRLQSDLVPVPDPAAGPNAPHFEMIYVNFWLDPVISSPDTGSFFTIVTALLTPTSRGTVKIRSTNPFEAPLIDPNMLTTDFDITAMRESVKAIKRFAAAPAWSDYLIAPLRNLSATADADIDAYVRQYTTTIFHPSSTAAMAPFNSTNGVVNPDLTVKGVEGLRIVDLSVFPFIPACHPQGPLYLLAERAADIIKGLV